MAPPTDERAVSRAAVGKREREPRDDVYWVAKTLPITATPRAPPSSRVVSLTADPTPCLPMGSDDRMDAVEDGIVIAKPKAITAKAITSRP